MVDVGLLSAFGASCEQKDEHVRLLREVDPVSRTEVVAELGDPLADGVDVADRPAGERALSDACDNPVAVLAVFEGLKSVVEFVGGFDLHITIVSHGLHLGKRRCHSPSSAPRIRCHPKPSDSSLSGMSLNSVPQAEDVQYALPLHIAYPQYVTQIQTTKETDYLSSDSRTLPAGKR